MPRIPSSSIPLTTPFSRVRTPLTQTFHTSYSPLGHRLHTSVSRLFLLTPSFRTRNSLSSHWSFITCIWCMPRPPLTYFLTHFSFLTSYSHLAHLSLTSNPRLVHVARMPHSPLAHSSLTSRSPPSRLQIIINRTLTHLSLSPRMPHNSRSQQTHPESTYLLPTARLSRYPIG